jgi:hypothetical protein
VREGHARCDGYHCHSRIRNVVGRSRVYMEKIAIGPGYPKGIFDLDVPPEEKPPIRSKLWAMTP